MIMCDCCGDKSANCKDYREAKDHLFNFLVCYKCLHRTDASFWAKMRWTNKKRGG